MSGVQLRKKTYCNEEALKGRRLCSVVDEIHIEIEIEIEIERSRDREIERSREIEREIEIEIERSRDREIERSREMHVFKNIWAGGETEVRHCMQKPPQLHMTPHWVGFKGIEKGWLR
jgi:hypothetical protein